MQNILSFKLFESTSFNWQDFYDKHKDSNDWHQSILNYGYNEWQKNHKQWQYSDMLDFVEKTMGKEARLLIQLGRYNQQVGNGGHLQYHENRYDGSDGDMDDDMPLHKIMIQMMEEFEYNKSEIGKKVYDIAKSFQIIPMANDCGECGGSGVVEEDDDEEEYDEEYESKKNEGYTFGCSNCGGSGEDPREYEILVEPSNIDDKYYELDDQWLKELEIKAKEFVIKNMFSGNIDASDLKNIKSFL